METELVALPITLKDLSHELRIPLTGIFGCAEFLKDDPLTPAQQEYLKDIVEQAERLEELANRLLGAKAITDNQAKNYSESKVYKKVRYYG